MTREAGFTLVEVLVALSIFALVGTLSTGLLVTAIDARERQEAAMDRVVELQQIRALWRDDAAQMVMRAHRTADGGYDGPALAGQAEAGLSYAGDSRQLAGFTRRGRANPGEAVDRSSLVRVGWRVEGGRLLRDIWSVADPAPSSVPQIMVLASGLEDVSVSFRYGRNWLSEPLRADNSGDAPVPDAIRLSYLDPIGREIEHVALTVTAGTES
ncbi:MAG: type 2a secretion system protein GspJ [Oceanicaulis sp. HLUCCA04]|nr:MAG: type 2a secretion system protein GspJ [Oceanicaulis sp. HLUCCA04]